MSTADKLADFMCRLSLNLGAETSRDLRTFLDLYRDYLPLLYYIVLIVTCNPLRFSSFLTRFGYERKEGTHYHINAYNM
jgi:hypothetical protein